MTNEELFLLRIADGEFSVDESGAVWRHRRIQTNQFERRTVTLSPPRRAERSVANGYPSVCFDVDGRKRRVYAHRVIWWALRGPIPAHLQVNHIDGVRSNNALSNLELISQRENVRHAFHVLKRTPTTLPGATNPHAKLTDDNVREIRLRRANGESLSTIARDFGVLKQTIGGICSRKTWKHVAEVEVRRA